MSTINSLADVYKHMAQVVERNMPISICPDCGGNELKRDEQNSFFHIYRSLSELRYGRYICSCGCTFKVEPKDESNGEPKGIVIK